MSKRINVGLTEVTHKKVAKAIAQITLSDAEVVPDIQDFVDEAAADRADSIIGKSQVKFRSRHGQCDNTAVASK